jgi:signal transduction histidine kinase
MAADIYKELWKIIHAGGEWHGEFHNRKKNGELYWEFASISPIKNSSGVITHFLAIKEDITERKRMEEELRIAKEKAEVANRIKGQFLANMSHELRTPMNSILGISKMLTFKSSDNLNEKQRKGLGLIHESGMRLLGLIDDILDLSKLEAGKVDIDLKEFSLDELISEIEEFTRSILKERLNFSVKKEDGLPLLIYSDRKKIVQIFINFISNAIKFTSSGEIEFKIRREGGRIVFSVRDTGIGIAKEHMDFIFEEFKQVDSSAAKNYEGTGLGLAISKKLITLLKGDIFVESQAGVGSTFSFYIPL